MNISEEALEHAHEAALGEILTLAFIPVASADEFAHTVARAAMEAAAPMLMAGAWDEGYSRGRVDGYFETREERNPYKEQP